MRAVIVLFLTGIAVALVARRIDSPPPLAAGRLISRVSWPPLPPITNELRRRGEKTNLSKPR